MTADEHTIGVEEEFFVVDAETRELRPRAERILDTARRNLDGRVELELNLAQIETSTPVTATLDELRGHLIELRSGLMAAAERHGCRIAATGTHPFSEWLGQQTTPKARYAQLDEDYQLLAWEQLLCGCHVHVAIPDENLAVQVIARSRRWLPILRALMGNSPFWQGIDTGYSSYRTELGDRWPTIGLPPELPSSAAYRELVDRLLATGTIKDPSQIYWDIRPSATYDTLEWRVADVCQTVEETVTIAGLVRSLVRTATAELQAGHPHESVPDPVLQAARWRAARYGLSDTLVDVSGRCALPAADVVASLLAHLEEDLRTHGEWEAVHAGVEKILRRGNGAERQRHALRNGDFRKVVDAVVAAAAPSTSW